MVDAFDKDSNADIDKAGKASALLALGLSRETPAYTEPSEEELACLLEAGLEAKNIPGIDATRKAQILDAIANDPITFSRWMTLVEAAETLAIAGFSPEASAAIESLAAKERPENSVISWLKSLFANPLRGFATAGGSLVAASALMLMVTTTGDYQSQVDKLYGEHGAQWHSLPAEQTSTRSVTSTLKKPLSNEELALLGGVSDGLNNLGEKFSIVNLAHSASPLTKQDASPLTKQDASPLTKQDASHSTEIDDELRDALNALGQIAALGHFKCSLGASDEYFSASMALVEKLQPSFEIGADETSLAIRNNLARAGDAETRICRLSKLVIERVSY